MRERKWKLAIWGMILGTAIAVGAMVGWWSGMPGASGMLGQGLGIVTLVFGGYSAANVSQKGVVGKNYRPELDDTQKEKK
jgi:zinc transporter ZupT